MKKYRIFLRIRGFFRTIYVRGDISWHLGHIILSIAVGFAAGLSALLLHFLIEQMRNLFEPHNFTRNFSINGAFIVAIPFLGGIVYATMSRFFPREARERGVGSIIKALAINNGDIPFRVTLFHFFAPIISIGSGAPLGPESPAAKLGSGVGSLLAQVLQLKREERGIYTAAGGGAAIAAIFNAPIAGVFFGVEVILMNDLRSRAVSALIIAAVVADVVSRSVLGDQHIFIIPPVQGIGGIGVYPFFLLLGLLCGALCVLYFACRKFAAYLMNDRLRIRNEYLRILPVTLVFGALLLYSYNLFGMGYVPMNTIFMSGLEIHEAVVLLVLRLLFLALFLVGGAYGGTFAPALYLGALLGYAFSYGMNAFFSTQLDTLTCSLVGMGGVLAGINSIPLTAILLVFEVTGNYKFILPLMLVSIISALVARVYNGGDVYSLELRRAGIDLSGSGEIDLLGKIRVRSLMRRDFPVVSGRTPFRDLLSTLEHTDAGEVFVVNDQGIFAGVVSLRDVRGAMIDNEMSGLLIAGDVTIPVSCVYENDPVSRAIGKIEYYDIESIPVAREDAPTTIIGYLTRQDIIQAYQRLLEERKGTC